RSRRAGYCPRPPAPALASGGDAARLGQRVEGPVDGDLEAAQRVGEARIVVRLAYEPRLARVRLAQHAFVVQHPGGGIVEGVVAALPVAVGARRLVREVQAGNGRMADEAVGDAPRLEDRALALAQPHAVGRDLLQRIRFS